MTREEIVKELEKAKNLTHISDLGYWSKVSTIEYWQSQLNKYDKENKTPVEQS